jgi:hypothetical protein
MSSQFCPFCQSSDRREFPAEINIHFPEMEGLTKPTVWVFPRLTVCMDCGVAQFSVDKAELDRLAERDSRSQSYKAAV